MVSVLGFLGEFEKRIDAKGRVPLPPKFREEFKEGGVISYGFDKCLIVYPTNEWIKHAETLSKLPEMRSKGRRLSRFIFSGAFPFELDGQSRIALPQVLRQYAGIRDTVIIAGVHDSLEIWSKGSWEQEKATMLSQATQLSESLEIRE